MLRWILCKLGQHQPIIKTMYNIHEDPHYTYMYWCARIGCKYNV